MAARLLDARDLEVEHLLVPLPALLKGLLQDLDIPVRALQTQLRHLLQEVIFLGIMDLLV